MVLWADMSVGHNESQNYIWNTLSESDCLGEGTFGRVYLGVHKRTGDKVAIKVFKHSLVTKETEMLKTLRHQYIIQLHAIEIEEYSKSEVMIMELCNGGSLMEFLNEPENAGGLLDGEFLLVLEHLSVGLDYLKRHNVIHRDVKPDNIMRHIYDDGRVVYKLTDFGAARELPEGQKFQSLHGTSEYLNPQMYKVVYFRDGNPEFGANTDLWSIGVTLFQTATGFLPFRTRDRHVLLMIYNEMKRNEGIISAFQHKHSEEVIYHKTLPQISRLSVALKELITPIIAGLFIQKPERQWSFTQYYDHVLELLSRKVINVFCVNKMQMLKIYITNETFSDFKYYISQQTEVSEENQVFLYKRSLIVNSFDSLHDVDSFSECVFLFDRSNTDVEPISNIQLTFENLVDFQQSFMLSSNFNDCSRALAACRDLCVFKNLMDFQLQAYKFFGTFMKDVKAYCEEEQRDLRKVYDVFMEKYSSTNSRVDTLKKLQDLAKSDDLNDFIEEFQKKTNVFNDSVSKLFAGLSNATIQVNCNGTHDTYLRIVVKELSDMKSLLMKLENSYKAKANQKQCDYEKIKIVHCVRTILEIFTDKVHPSFENFVRDAKKWHKNEFFSQVRNLSALKKTMYKYKCDLNGFEEEIHSRSEQNLKAIEAQKVFFSKEKLLQVLEKYKQNNADMKSIVEDNLEMAKKLTHLASNLNLDDVNDE